MKISKFTRRLFLLAWLLTSQVSAQVIIDSTPPANTTLPMAADFATEVLGNPWDMNSVEDLGNYVTASDTLDMSPPVFSDGVMTTQTLVQGFSYLQLLSPAYCSTNPSGITGATQPIDTNKYRYLTLRMYSSNASQMRIVVNTACTWFADNWTSQAINTSVGWHTYQIDLQTIPHEFYSGTENPSWNNRPATGIRILPAIHAGTQIQLDWVTLTGDVPSETVEVDYSFSPVANKYYSMFLDDNSTLTDGFVRALHIAEGTSENTEITSEGLIPGEYKLISIESNDWATLNNNPWDMNSAGDIFGNYGLSVSFTGGNMTGSTSSIPNYFYLNMGDETIDTSAFNFMRIPMTLSGVTVGATMVVYMFDANGSTIFQEFKGISNGFQNYDFTLGTLSARVAKIHVTIASQQNVSFTIPEISLRNDGLGAIGSAPSATINSWDIKVNTPPQLKILQPDKLGGADFATEVLGNPWNFDDTADVAYAYNVTNPAILPNNSVDGIQGNYFSATSVATTADGDPHQYSIYTDDPTKMIDTRRYKNLSFRLLTAREQDLNEGSVVRVIWHSQPEAPANFLNGDDIVTFNGWRTYSYDMDTIQLEELNHPVGSVPNPWYDFTDAFRIDPHEFSEATEYFFDFIRITADDESNTKFAITYDLSDEDGDDASVSFYYHFDPAATSGGVLIGTKLLSDETSVLLWNTSAISNGNYYVYGIVNDGHNSHAVKASGPILISDRVQDTTVPVLQLDGPVSAQKIYNDFVVKGYALDNIQTASVEVFIDGELLARFNPERFDSRAQTDYSALTESGNAGFFETIDASSIPTGPRDLEVLVYDTAGNVTSSGIIGVVKYAGANPDPEIPPTATQASPITIENPVVELPALTISRTLKAKKGTLSMTIGNTVGCTNVNLLWSDSANGLVSAPQTIKGFATASRDHLVLAASKLNPVQKPQKKKSVFLKANCDGVRESSVISIPVLNIKNATGKKVKTHKAWAKQLGKKLKYNN